MGGVSPPHSGRVGPVRPGRAARLSPVWTIAGILALALVLRLAALALLGYNPDITNYAESNIVAKNLVDGRGYIYDFYGLRTARPLQSFMPPLYVGLVYAALHWRSNPALALGSAQAVLSALVCAAVYVISLTLTRRRSTALLAALAAALYPVLIVMVTVWHSLILHTAILLWAVAVTLLLPNRRFWGWAALAGALWGLLALGRPAILAFMPFVVFWLWLNQRERGEWLKTSAILAVAVILTVLPWTIRNYRIHGQVIAIATNGGATFWNGNNPFTTGSGQEVYSGKLAAYLGTPADDNEAPIVQVQPYPLPRDLQADAATVAEIDLDRRQFQAGLAFIRQQPREWLALLREKAVGFAWFRRNIGASYEAAWTPYYKIIYASLLIALGAGLAISLRHWRRYALLYLLFAFYAVTTVAYHVQTRFRWEIEPLFLVFAALAVSAAAEQVSATWRAYRKTSRHAAS